MLKAIGSKILRDMSCWPLKLLPMRLRAKAIEDLTESMVSKEIIPNGSILFYTPYSGLIWRSQALLTKEPDTIAWIDGFAEGSVFWDVGANVGVYSLYAAIKRQAKVRAFEPSAANVYVLNRNIQINFLNNYITAYCIALAGRTELGVLNMSSMAMGAAVSQFGKSGEMSRYGEKSNPCGTQGMVGFSIDELIKEFSPLFPNYLKLDVDGLEFLILHGAKNTLCDERLISLMVELNVSNEEEYSSILNLLKESGFRLVSKGLLQGTKEEVAANHLFERTSH